MVERRALGIAVAGHAHDAVAGRETRNTGADADHLARDLEFGDIEIATGEMLLRAPQVGAVDAGGFHRDEQIRGARLGLAHALHRQGRAVLARHDDDCFHHASRSL